MARVRRGPSGAVYGLIVFVFLFITCGVLAIMFYSQLTEQRVATSRAQDDLNRFVAASELNKTEVTDLLNEAKGADRSVITHLMTREGRLKLLVTGSSDVTSDQVEQQLTAQGVNVNEGRTVISVVSGLKSELDAEKTKTSGFETQIKEREEQLTKLGDEIQQAADTHKAKVDELQAKIDELAAANTAYEAQVTEQQKALTDRLDESAANYAEQVRTRDATIKTLEGEINKLQVRVKQLAALIGPDRPKAPDMIDDVDGTVVATNYDENLVYINLGQADHLVLGMTFEVFDPQQGVRVSEDGKTLERGKASIEVMDIAPNSAVCRIVRGSATRPILANDLIANLVYDKNRIFKFYVYGEFDLDNDGRPGFDDYNRIVNLIRQWGGVVVEGTRAGSEDRIQVPFDTDFVIIGKEPELPSAPPAGTDDPEALAAAVRGRQLYEQYSAAVGSAKELSIPVLNQNRFLALVGFYRTR